MTNKLLKSVSRFSNEPRIPVLGSIGHDEHEHMSWNAEHAYPFFVP